MVDPALFAADLEAEIVEDEVVVGEFFVEEPGHRFLGYAHVFGVRVLLHAFFPAGFVAEGEKDQRAADEEQKKALVEAVFPDEAGDDEEKAEPSEGDTVEYEVEYKNPKTKKTAKKVVECEVIKVNKKKQTVTLKSLDGEETEYENVGFDELK